MRVVLVSLEPWDFVWRRNQHLSAQLVRQGLVDSIVFVDPPLLWRRGRRWTPEPGIEVRRPVLLLPKRLGGLWLAGLWLRLTALRGMDVLWVNDPTLGVHCLGDGQPALYDVTDDWRTFGFPQRIKRRFIRAEDKLARCATTVVCSEVLRDRWRERYGVGAPVVHNGVDLEAWEHAEVFALPGAAPHVGYVGTLHQERLDLDLLLDLANDHRIGTVHLVGPDALSEAARSRLRSAPKIVMHGPVPAAEVPSWMKSMDVLVSPHLVNDFTLSLDAIKSYEYLASGRPVVATGTSGFQRLGSLASLTSAVGFPNAVVSSVGLAPTHPRDVGVWSRRAVDFAGVLLKQRGPVTYEPVHASGSSG